MKLFDTANDQDDRTQRDKKHNLKMTCAGILIWLVLSSLCIIVYALSIAYQCAAERWGAFLTGLSSSALLGAAFISIGALLGFIFGIPRSPKVSPQTPPPSPSSAAPSGSVSSSVAPDDHRFTPNTNLEDISDWLTKILVGAGLAQLAVLPGQLRRLAEFFQVMPLKPEAVLTIILNFFVLGFMGSYLLTRLFLTQAFQSVEEIRGASLAVTRVARDLLLEISPGASKEERDATYETYIYTCLYLDPPDGFERAIKACLEYLQGAGEQPNPRILAYQAMAYGQRYDWEQKRGATKDALSTLRATALEAIRRAVNLQPQLRQLLHMTWDPNDPTKLRGEENDLEVFFRDPEFKAVLDPI